MLKLSDKGYRIILTITVEEFQKITKLVRKLETKN